MDVAIDCRQVGGEDGRVSNADHPATVGDFPVGRRIQSLQLFTHECVKIFSRVDSWQEVGPQEVRQAVSAGPE